MERTDDLIVDLTDAQLRGSHRIKWGIVPDDVLPAWIAEMDFALAEPITAALHAGIDAHALGYPAPDVDVIGACVAWNRRRFGWEIDPAAVTKLPTVLGGLDLVLRHISDDAPVILPTPAYPPFLTIPGEAGRALLTVPTDPWGPEGATLPLAGIADAIDQGGRTLILCNPHNPLGRAWRRDELEALRDLVEPRGVRVVSDEIHAPLTVPGVTYTPYLTVASPGAPAVALLASTKAFNCPGVPCAQLVWNDPADAARLDGLGEHATPWSLSLPDLAAMAAYTDCDDWMEALRARIAANHELLAELLAESLPEARMLPLEATYLAWVNLRAYGVEDPAAVALEHGRVRLGSGFGPGSEGCVRVNLATSPERMREITRRLASSFSATPE